jgi:hypothetical protein
MYSWRKLTKEQLKELNIETYEDEVVLYQKDVDPEDITNRFFFNAQEFFSEEEIESFLWVDSL